MRYPHYAPPTALETIIGAGWQHTNFLKYRRTVFTIAHRISTIKSADVVVCLDNARIAEIGTYEELLKQDGVFKKLVEHQLLG